MQVFIGQHQVLRTHKILAIARQTFTENPTRKPFTNKTEIGDEVETKSWKGNTFQIQAIRTMQKVTSLSSILLRLLLFRKDTLVQIVYSHRTPIPTHSSHSPFHQKDN